MKKEFCMKCLHEIRQYPCPHCGYTPSKREKDDQALRAGTILHGRYLAGLPMGRGGFGITYAALDLTNGRKVAIKEYFPGTHAMRSESSNQVRWSGCDGGREQRQEGVDSVLKEARKMRAVRDVQDVVHVLDIFGENDTAYIVMEFVNGITLLKFLEQNGKMNWSQAQQIVVSAAETLEQIHKAGLVHRDISPDNIMITAEGRTCILDLGAAKILNQNNGVSTELVAKSGFSPPEQYTDRGRSGPWSDVYALAACLYYALTLSKLPEAFVRAVDDKLRWDLPEFRKLPVKVLDAMKHAMALKIGERTQSMSEFLKELGAHHPEKVPETAAPAEELPETQDLADTSEQKPAEAETPNPEEPAQSGENTAPATGEGSSGAPVLAFLFLAAFLIWGYFNFHVWSEAECSRPETCVICGETRGWSAGAAAEKGHSFRDGVCTICGKKAGR